MLRLLFTILLSMEVVCFAQQSDFLWAKKLGGPNAFNSQGRNIVADDSENIYLAGHFYNTVDFDPGPATANLTANNIGGYLAKYDSSGNYQWAFKIGKYVQSALLDDSMNIYVSGSFYEKVDFDPGQDTVYLISDSNETNVFIAKYTSSSVFVWARKVPGNYGSSCLTLDNIGNLFVTERFADTISITDSTFLFSGGLSDAHFAKFDNNGNLLWINQITGSDNSVTVISSIVADQSGNCYITGMIDPNINNDFDSGTDTAYLVTTGTYDDGFVAKYDADGNYVWTFAIDAIQVKSYSITTDKNDNVYIAGSIIGDADFDPGAGIANLNPVGNYYTPFFAKYNSDGNYLFAKKITSYGTDEIFNIAVDSSGRISVAGYFTDSNADFDPGPNVVNLTFTFNSLNNYDAFWAVYDSLGNYVLAQSIYGNNETVAHDIAFYGNNLLVTGYFSDSIYFDNTATKFLVSEGLVQYTDNAFFAKYQLDFTSRVYNANANSESIKIYPNPATSQITLTSNSNIISITIHNIFGQIVFQSILPTATINYHINLSSYPIGIYFFTANINGQLQSLKLIKI